MLYLIWFFKIENDFRHFIFKKLIELKFGRPFFPFFHPFQEIPLTLWQNPVHATYKKYIWL